jgi:hypothetical protein
MRTSRTCTSKQNYILEYVLNYLGMCLVDLEERHVLYYFRYVGNFLSM